MNRENKKPVSKVRAEGVRFFCEGEVVTEIISSRGIVSIVPTPNEEIICPDCGGRTGIRSMTLKKFKETAVQWMCDDEICHTKIVEHSMKRRAHEKKKSGDPAWAFGEHTNCLGIRT